MERFHVLPVNDIKEHTESEDCACNPKIESGININGEWAVIVHNAFDGREHVEKLTNIEELQKQVN